MSEVPAPTGLLTRRLAAVTAGMLLVNTAALTELAIRLGALRTSIKWQSAILGSLVVGLALIGLLAWARGSRGGLFQRLEARLLSLGPALGRLRGMLFVILIPVLPLLTMSLAVKVFEPLSLRIVAWWLLSILGGLILSNGRAGDDSLLRLAFSGAALGVGFQVAGYLPEISTYPLSLGWSEASRYYNASLFFAERVYGQVVPLPVLHPSRYLLQSVPFLFGALPLWVHRFWQVLLWIGVTLGFSLTLARRTGVRSILARLALAASSYLFLMQGPVYYHLLVSAWIVIALAHAQRPWRTLLAVILASAWAGISRVNWMPVPAILAIVIYLLGTRLVGNRRGIVGYLAWPAALAVAGALAALAANQAYASLSGNPLVEFRSSFSSDLLWYRLFPSATYPLGVLPAILIASALPVALMVLRGRSPKAGLHPLRWLGLAGGMAVLFLGGLLVSAKIGGGGNLHNLDAYLVLLLVVIACLSFGNVVTELDSSPHGWRPPTWALGAALVIPVAFTLSVQAARPARDLGLARSVVDRISVAAAKASQDGQAVLFISERHLIAFEGLRVRLEPDYEKVYLMEMAMADNEAYLNRFYADLAAHRFGLIVTERLSTGLKGSEFTFGEENDVWATRVAQPLLRDYRLEEEIDGVWLMVPRQPTVSEARPGRDA